MRFAFTQEQQQLREIARKFLAQHGGSRHLRAVMASERGFDEQLWRRIGQELGWPALHIPEAYGGFGFSQVEIVALIEELGRANFASPFFATVCLAANALMLSDNHALKQQWLPELASGAKTATLAYSETNTDWDIASVQAIYEPKGEGYVLSGSKHYVVDGHSADLLIIAVRQPGSHGRAGLALFAVPSHADGLTRTQTPTMDQTRRMARLDLNHVYVAANQALTIPGQAGAILATTLDLARVALAAEQVGGAQACLDMAVEYAKVRKQFDTPIGKFQAIKHKCADMMTRVEAARSAAYYAGWIASYDLNNLHEAAIVAQVTCSEAFFFCAAENIQIHGGIGFTWEHDAHLYFKRAKASEEFLGSVADHRRWFAEAIGI